MIVQNESAIRLSIFLGLLLSIGLCECFSPRRKLNFSWSFRWLNHLALMALNTVIVKWTIPIGAVLAAELASQNQWGLLNRIEIPETGKFILVIILFDLLIYLQHLFFHRIRFLWRIHCVHHADHDFDVTTGLRFHPMEILLSMGLKIGAIIALGAPALPVMVFEILLNAGSLFTHGNFRLPEKLDRFLRFLVVTPDMHRIHHSTLSPEMHSNFGFHLSIWDRLFRTYQETPELGQEKMTFGLPEFPQDDVQRIDGMLLLPFLKRKSVPEPETKKASEP